MTHVSVAGRRYSIRRPRAHETGRHGRPFPPGHLVVVDPDGRLVASGSSIVEAGGHLRRIIART